MVFRMPARSWFDKLTTNGQTDVEPFALSLSKSNEIIQGISETRY
jgi:hypothetical protein